MPIEYLDDALDTFQVSEVAGLDKHKPDLYNWFYVTNQDGIIAYFSDEKDACRFRLNEVNRLLNK